MRGGLGIRSHEWVFPLAQGAAMFIFPRSIAAPLVGLCVAALMVVLDALFTVS